MNSQESFRLSIPQRTLPVAVAFPCATLLLYACLAFTDDPMGAGELGRTVGWACFGVAGVALLRRSHGILLTEDALVVVNGWRRTLPWAGIDRLEVRRTLGVRQVVAHTKDGRRTTLPAPTSFLDKRFEDKVRTLTERWQERRDPEPPMG
ncbi:hypothetical protein [Streptomyces sp. NPDC096132]|uniref:hypothetical protein n=1 Tax=Streptomyces sp. NPDC096132 TaxID=3366075 RepID=UPI0037FE7BD6